MSELRTIAETGIATSFEKWQSQNGQRCMAYISPEVEGVARVVVKQALPFADPGMRFYVEEVMSAEFESVQLLAERSNLDLPVAIPRPILYHVGNDTGLLTGYSYVPGEMTPSNLTDSERTKAAATIGQLVGRIACRVPTYDVLRQVPMADEPAYSVTSFFDQMNTNRERICQKWPELGRCFDDLQDKVPTLAQDNTKRAFIDDLNHMNMAWTPKGDVRELTGIFDIGLRVGSLAEGMRFLPFLGKGAIDIARRSLETSLETPDISIPSKQAVETWAKLQLAVVAGGFLFRKQAVPDEIISLLRSYYGRRLKSPQED